MLTWNQKVSIPINNFFEFFVKMKNWPLRFFFGWFFGDTNFFQSKVKKIENVVIGEKAYIILEIMSTQGYDMWTNELSTQERVYNQWNLSVK
jgi:hypothetical protein